MTKPTFPDVWMRLLAHAGRPFLTDGGKEFSYAVEGDDALRLSHGDALLTRACLALAWAAMPCVDRNGLPKACQPRGYVWALLHDTRASGTAFLPELPAALAKAAKTEDKPPQPKKKKRRRTNLLSRGAGRRTVRESR